MANYDSFMKTIAGFNLTSSNTPLDGRAVVELDSDIKLVPFPYIGQLIYSCESKGFFIVKSLKDGWQDVQTGEFFDEDPQRPIEEVRMKKNSLVGEFEFINKVDAVEGKSLIADSEIERLLTLKNYDDAELRAAIEELVNSKVDKVEGKSLMDDTEIERLANVDNYDDAELRTAIEELANSKVDKVEGKSLMDDAEIERLANVDNYDDSEVRELIDSKIADLVDGAPEALDTLKELGDALKSHEDAYDSLLQVVGNKADVDHVHEEYLTEHQDISGKADKEHEHEQYLTEHQNLDHKVDKVEGKSLMDDKEIERLANINNYDDSEIRELLIDDEPYETDMFNNHYVFACGHPVFAENIGNELVITFGFNEQDKKIVLSNEVAAKTVLVGGFGDKHINKTRIIPSTHIHVKNATLKAVQGGNFFEGVVGKSNIVIEDSFVNQIIGGGDAGKSLEGKAANKNIVQESNVKLTNVKNCLLAYAGGGGFSSVGKAQLELNNCEVQYVMPCGSNGFVESGLVIINDGIYDYVSQVNRGIASNTRVILNNGHVKKLYFGAETEDSSANGVLKNGYLELNNGLVDNFFNGLNNGIEIANEDVRGSIMNTIVANGDISMLEIKVQEPGLDEKLASKADVDHIHEEYLTEHQDISGKADVDHIHEEYLTEHQDISGKADVDHIHEEYLTEHQDISGKADVDHVHEEYLTEHQNLDHKVDKVEGKSLMDDVEIERLANVDNYDDTEVRELIDSKIADLVNGAPEALNTLKELGDALKSHEDAYDSLLEVVGNKADKEHEHEQYLTEHQDISGKADVDHIHEEYLTEHQNLDHKVDKVEGKSLMDDAEIERLANVDNYDDSELKERIDILETINLESKPYIDKNGMLVLCGCPAVVRPNTGKLLDPDADETDVIVSVRFFNDSLDKFVFSAQEFASLRICMGYGAEGVGTKRNIAETSLELYDLDKVFIIDGGSQVTGEIGTVNIIAERCNYIDGIQGARAMNGGERNIVHNFNIKVKDCGLIDTLFGGGNGFAVVWNNHIEVENCNINYLIAGGSNGFVRKSEVILNGGNISVMQGVNRGILEEVKLVVNNGNVNKFYAAGDMEDASVTGIQYKSIVELNGGQIENFAKGNSDLVEFNNIEGHIMNCVVVNGDTSMLEVKVQEPGLDEKLASKADVDHVHEEYLTEHQNLDHKVDKVEGKSLMDDIEIERLASVHNYNDSELKALLLAKAEKDHSHEQYITITRLDAKADVDHIHEEYLTEHQNLDHKVDKVEGKSLMDDTEIERLANVDNYDDSELKERVNVLETINLESKPYIDKNGMLVLCGCPVVIRPNTGKLLDPDADETDVIVSVRFFNDSLDKFVFSADEFSKLRICMGYGAEGVGTKRNIVETSLELYDLDKVFIIDGGSQVTGEIGTVNIIAERCNYIDGIQGARAMNGGERNIVHNFNIKVKDCGLIDTLFGGGNGFAVVWNNHIEVENCNINYLIAGGSNGFVRKSEVILNGGNISVMQGVNRGILEEVKLVVNNGNVNKFYAAGDMEDASVTGIQHKSIVELNGGQIENFAKGNSNLVEFNNIEGHIMNCVVVNGDTSMLEVKVQEQAPIFAFNAAGELVVTINGISKVFVPKSE